MRNYYVVDAKKWLDKVNGNTYHSVNVYKNGELLDRVAIAYGYGSHYEQTALELLKKHGETDQDIYWKFCEEKGRKNVLTFCNDVKRKKDL